MGWGAGAGSTNAFSSENPELASEIEKLGSANTALWQIEVESLGKMKDFTSEQFDTIARMNSAIKEYAGWSSFAGKIINHKDWAPDRKIDTLYDKSIFINDAINRWNLGAYANGGLLMAAKGTFVSGKESNIPALVSNGEYVMSREAVGRVGVGTMRAINAGSYNTGGFVGSFKDGGRVRSMPRYKLNQPVGYNGSGSVVNNTRNFVNVTINADGITDPNKLANMVVNKINMETSRRQHGRSVR
jgi:hypothetical protein